MAQPPSAAAPQKRTRQRLSDEALIHLLCQYAFSDVSWEKWMELHPKDHHRNELTALKHDLLTRYGLNIRETLSVPGAYISLFHLTELLLAELVDHHLLPYRADETVLRFPIKISFDGRKILRHSNVGWLIGFPTVKHNSQSPAYQYTWALADLRETELRNHPIWEEIGLNASIERFHTEVIVLSNHKVTLDPYVVGDWKSLCYMFDVSQANTCQPLARVCGWCHTTKGYLNKEWFLATNIFKECPVVDASIAAIPSLRVSEVRYCAMHGCNRLLDNSLQLIASFGEREAVTKIVHKVASKWVAQGHKGRLQCFEMKKFWERNLDTEVIASFARHTQVCAMLVRGAQGIERAEWTAHALVTRLLGACRAYHTFSYTILPPYPLYCALLNARDDILSVFAHFHRRLPPTTHWLTTHFIHFVRLDGTAYTTLQEGPEHHHKIDERNAHITYTAACGNHMPFTRYEQLLRRYELQRILRTHFPEAVSQPAVCK